MEGQAEGGDQQLAPFKGPAPQAEKAAWEPGGG